MKKNKPLYFTNHQLKRMAQRGITKAIVQTVVDNGVWVKGEEAYSFVIEYNGIIVILYEQKTQYNVSTCKLNRMNTEKAERIREEKNINFWKAVHRVVKELNFESLDNRL